MLAREKSILIGKYYGKKYYNVSYLYGGSRCNAVHLMYASRMLKETVEIIMN